MSVLLTAASLKAFFDANPSRYKSAVYGQSPLADGYLPSAWLDYQLCTPDSGASKANPSVQSKIALPFTAQQLLGAISTASQVKVMNSASIGKVIDAISAQDRVACNSWAALQAAAGNISASELTAVQAVINATALDPNWTATIALCDLEANFVDALGNAPARLSQACNADGSSLCAAGTAAAVAFLNGVLGRN